MNKLTALLQPVSLCCLLAGAHLSHGQQPATAHLLATHAPTAHQSRRVAPAPLDSAPPAPLMALPNATPGWISLAGSLPTGAPLTADLLGTGASPLASRTWRSLPNGRVQLELNLGSVPAGTYVLRLSQDGQQWRLPLAVK